MTHVGYFVGCFVGLGLIACTGACSSHQRVARGSSDAGRTHETCPPPNGSEPPIDFNGAPLSVLCHTVYVEPVTTPEQRALVKRWYREALADLASVFGASKADPPVVVVCATKACAVALTRPTERSHATMEPRPTVFINGIGPLTKGTIVHEMIHIELERRRAGGGAKGALPTWFEEGVATFVGDNGFCPAGTTLAIDDLRRLSASYAWTNFTNQPGKLEPTYCQARDEIAAWVSSRNRKALVDLIDSVFAAGSFDDLYGPPMRPGASMPDAVDGRFSLDERTGTTASDGSGHSHGASLVGGARWATGHTGSAVNVSGGAHVRADGFVDMGLPDKPFSISLWARPQANAKVLVHIAANPAGDGFCLPILGFDSTGRLVAQVIFAADPSAFLTATGPVLATNAWSHLAMTWSANDGVRLYVNGVLSASAAPASQTQRHRSVPASPMHLLFGSDNGAKCWTGGIEPGAWTGVMDEIRVYNYALTAPRVVTDMTP